MTAAEETWRMKNGNGVATEKQLREQRGDNGITTDGK
jgi:hypothetical protein